MRRPTLFCKIRIFMKQGSGLGQIHSNRLHHVSENLTPALLNKKQQEAQLSPRDRAMRLVSSNLANYHATVQKVLKRQVLTKPMV